MTIYQTHEFPTLTARILVVDDEPANLKLLDAMLRMQGYANTEFVSDPRLVLDAWIERKPDLILLDINMPFMDGYQVMAQIRAHIEAQGGDALSPPIVILTAQSGNEVLVRAFEGGASDFLVKPINRRELMARVHNMLVAQFGRRLLHERRAALEEMVQARTRELSESRLDIVRRLGRASEYRDNETGLHIMRMSQMSAALASRAGWDDADVELILNASPLHDVGKIGIPDGILLKPGPLTPDERKIMQEHPAMGADILGGSRTELLEMACEIALCHHEKWDGTGYPQGLAGTEIPQSARIVAIADVFDALTSHRPYKKAWSSSEAIEYIKKNAGSHFDPELVGHLEAVLAEFDSIRQRHREPARTPVTGEEVDERTAVAEHC